MAQETLVPSDPRAWPASRGIRRAATIPGWVLPSLIVALGFALRAFRLNYHSVWLDEVYTIDYARRPWMEVLGFQGAYDNHPPLYYALVKLVGYVEQEALAARALSMISGTATIVVVYLLTSHLVSRPAGLLAGLILAVSPLHIWYSQEGRMFAPTVFVVTLSFYFLSRFLEDGDRGWGSAYVLTLVSSLLLDYSALYCLAPQIVVAVYMARSRRRALREWMVAVTIAAIAFLPWGSQALGALEEAGERPFLFVTWDKIFESAFTVMGLPGQTSYYWGIVPTPWSEWPHSRPIAVAFAAAILLLSAVALSGRFRMAFVVGSCLFVGTIVTAATFSVLISPGYADRTVLATVVGWAILAGAAPFGRVPNGGRALSVLALAVLFSLSAYVSVNIYRDSSKEPFRELADTAAAVNPFGYPIYADFVVKGVEPFIPIDVASTSITAYEPEIDVRPPDEIGSTIAFWHAYADYSFVHEEFVDIHDSLTALGFERVMNMHFPSTVDDALRFDFYILEEVGLGEPSQLPEWPLDFGPRSSEPGWSLLSGTTEVEASTVGNRELVIFGGAGLQDSATIIVPAAGETLYILDFDVWLQLPVGGATATLACQSTNEGRLATSTAVIEPVPQTEESTAEERVWDQKRLAVVCPSGTEHLRISLGNAGVGETRFRGLYLSSIEPATYETGQRSDH